jgi:hypothetical protein
MAVISENPLAVLKNSAGLVDRSATKPTDLLSPIRKTIRAFEIAVGALLRLIGAVMMIAAPFVFVAAPFVAVPAMLAFSFSTTALALSIIGWISLPVVEFSAGRLLISMGNVFLDE